MSEPSVPELELGHLFERDARGRILSTREPTATAGPLFVLARTEQRCAWAIRADVPEVVALQLDELAAREPPAGQLRDAPVFALDYQRLARRAGWAGQVSSGPTFRFPDELLTPAGIALVSDEAALGHHFRGWVVGEIAQGRAPVCAIIDQGHPVSVCFCARRSPTSASAGVETAQAFRGRGYAARVTTAWALAIRATGRVPLYSTSWANTASLAVTRTLGLVPTASTWSLEG